MKKLLNAKALMLLLVVALAFGLTQCKKKNIDTITSAAQSMDLKRQIICIYILLVDLSLATSHLTKIYSLLAKPHHSMLIFPIRVAIFRFFPIIIRHKNILKASQPTAVCCSTSVA